MDKDSQIYGKILQHKERRLSGKERGERKERRQEKEDAEEKNSKTLLPMWTDV